VRTKYTQHGRDLREARRHQAIGESAIIRYLDRMCRRLLDPNDNDDSDLIAARDLDTIPLRPRTSELEALHDYAQKRSRSLPNLHFVALGDRLKERFGPSLFGQAIFLDHVHFNQRGHRLVAEAVADALAPALALDAPQAT